jgi:hypothetical protein
MRVRATYVAGEVVMYGWLSTEHVASRHGLPVFVSSGHVLAPADLPAGGEMHVADTRAAEAARKAGFPIAEMQT